MRVRLAPAVSLALSAGCALILFATQGAEPAPRPAWALALHGGAGSPSRAMPAERQKEYHEALAAALAAGRALLESGEPAVDVVEALVARLEDDPLFNAGRGAVLNAEGRHELDAAIMDGATLACGAVAGVTTVRHPVTLARLVMTRSGHVLLAGAGAERFADETGVERVANDWFSTPERREEYEKRRAEEERKKAGAPPAAGHGTVGAVALDRAGHLAAATSTGGLTWKRWGRVGDVPIVGAGTYADDRTVAVSCTGKGEEFIRHGVARQLAALVEIGGLSPEQAAKRLIHETLKPGDGGLIALGRDGAIVLAFNTDGMYRAAADASGRFETAIW